MQKNHLLTSDEVGKFLSSLVREQIKEMEKDGMTEKQIQNVLNAVFGGFAYGPL